MAVFPSDTCILVAGYTEEFDPSVGRTDMERGPPKMRVPDGSYGCCCR